MLRGACLAQTFCSRLKGAGQTSLSAVGTTTDTSTTTTTSASDVYTSGVSLYPQAYNTIPPVRFSNIDSMIMSVAHPDDIAETMEKVREVLRETHKLGDADDDFRIRSFAEFAEGLHGIIGGQCMPGFTLLMTLCLWVPEGSRFVVIYKALIGNGLDESFISLFGVVISPCFKHIVWSFHNFYVLSIVFSGF